MLLDTRNDKKLDQKEKAPWAFEICYISLASVFYQLNSEKTRLLLFVQASENTNPSYSPKNDSMIPPSRQAPRKKSSSLQLFNPLQLCVARGILFAVLLILCVRWSLREQLFFPKTKPIENFSDIVIGVLTTQEYFSPRFGYQLSTFLSDILGKGGNVVVSVERGFITFSQFMQKVRYYYPRSEQLNFFESRCPVGYSQLICRMIEFLTFMVEAHPGTSWYIRIDDDTLLIPKTLHSLLRELNPQDSVGLGSPSFYFCTSPFSCTHKRYPGLPWKDIDQIVRLVRGGAGYVLSRSVILWIISNTHHISATAQQLNSAAEDLSIFYALQKHMRHFRIIQARSFYFERPEVALRFSPFRDKSDIETPVSFHMNHNLENGYNLYMDLNEWHRTEKGHATVDGMGVLKSDASSQMLAKIRSQAVLKMMKCMRGATEVKIQLCDWDSQLRDGLIDMVLLLLINRLDEGREYDFILETLDEAAGAMRALCVPGTRNKNEDEIVLQTRTFPARHRPLSHSMESREGYEVREVNMTQRIQNLTLVSGGEQRLKLSHVGFVNTIDLLVDCEDDGKGIRHNIDTYRKRKKSLWEWNALRAVRGYARSRMPGEGYFWQMRYLQYMSYLRDSWECDKDECVYLSFYLRRGRVVLTERREHRLALVVLQVAHVYICDEEDIRSKKQSLCAGELPFVKCVSNLAEATEALVEFLLGQPFFNRTWNLRALISRL